MGRADGAGAGPRATIAVGVACCSAPGKVEVVDIHLPHGASVADALRASGLGGEAEPAPSVGVWGVLRELGHRLRDGDRVEIYRPLTVDPMEARRRRAQTQRAAKAAAKGRLPSARSGA
jgi:uncharacterized protein